jgi:hypothetical protein
VAWKL